MSKPINPHPEKALPHVVTALITKRGELAGHIEHLQAELRQAVVDLDNVEATLRIFAPDADIRDLAPRNVPASQPAARGETLGIILTTLRDAKRPLTTNELTETVMRARALQIDNSKLFSTMSRRVSACLRYAKNERGVVKAMPGPGQQHLWQINSANA
jgi:hypothetical protein